MKRWLFLAVAALPLAGCALPPALSIASLALDVGSYAATGKSASDHVLSGVVGEDCRMLGALEGEICRDEQDFEAAVANLEPLRPLPEEAPVNLLPTADTQLAVARRAPVQRLTLEPPLAEPQSRVQTLQLASAGIVAEASPLEGMTYLSAGALRPVSAPQDSQPVPLTAVESLPDAAVDKQLTQRSEPRSEQLAALAPVSAEEPAAADSRGLVFDDSGRVLGIAYAFQNPLAAMDGNRESLSNVEILDR